jgi:hypothetical protein
MFIKNLIFTALLATNAYAWINDCDLVLHNDTNISPDNVVANGDAENVYETNTTKYDTAENCKTAILDDTRFDSSHYLIAFTCTYVAEDAPTPWVLTSVYAPTNQPYIGDFNTTGDIGKSYLCTKVCTDDESCGTGGECVDDRTYCHCPYPNHGVICGQEKDCSCT